MVLILGGVPKLNLKFKQKQIIPRYLISSTLSGSRDLTYVLISNYLWLSTIKGESTGMVVR